jgi:chromosome segregation ATPase
LTVELVTMKRALSEEKASWSAVDRSLVEEKAAHQIAEQSLQTFDEAKVNLVRDLELVLASLTATTSKLPSKSFTLDTTMIREHEMEIKLKAAEEKLKAAEEKLKSQGQLLDSVQQALSKRQFSSSVVMSSAMANVMALVKNHIPDFNAEILRKDFTVDDAERAALVDSAYDMAHHFISFYNFSALTKSDDNNSPSAL